MGRLWPARQRSWAPRAVAVRRLPLLWRGIFLLHLIGRSIFELPKNKPRNCGAVRSGFLRLGFALEGRLVGERLSLLRLALERLLFERLVFERFVLEFLVLQSRFLRVATT